jgi:hypothetical protein
MDMKKYKRIGRKDIFLISETYIFKGRIASSAFYFDKRVEDWCITLFNSNKKYRNT